MWCRIVAETTTEHRINDRIRAREVRLVDPDGVQLGIKALPEALAIAKELDLDLVEVAPMANPPVCRIMDFGSPQPGMSDSDALTLRRGSSER